MSTMVMVSDIFDHILKKNAKTSKNYHFLTQLVQKMGSLWATPKTKNIKKNIKNMLKNIKFHFKLLT